MTGIELDLDDIAALATLANGIIPPDERDAGAAVVDAGVRLGEKIRRGVNAALYSEGLKAADAMSREKYGLATGQLNPPQVFELLGALRDSSPAFFKQLRMDVCALYLSDPGVWQRIGFPGPSTDSGGYPDFDQPQIQKVTWLKEAAS